MAGGNVEGSQHEKWLQEFWLKSLKVTCIGNVTLAKLFSVSASNEKKNPTLGQYCPIEASGMMEMS